MPRVGIWLAGFGGFSDAHRFGGGEVGVEVHIPLGADLELDVVIPANQTRLAFRREQRKHELRPPLGSLSHRHGLLVRRRFTIHSVC